MTRLPPVPVPSRNHPACGCFCGLPWRGDQGRVSLATIDTHTRYILSDKNTRKLKRSLTRTSSTVQRRAERCCRGNGKSTFEWRLMSLTPGCRKSSDPASRFVEPGRDISRAKYAFLITKPGGFGRGDREGRAYSTVAPRGRSGTRPVGSRKGPSSASSRGRRLLADGHLASRRGRTRRHFGSGLFLASPERRDASDRIG